MNTAPNTLAKKLDQINRSQLGIQFDETMIWDNVSGRLKHEQVSYRLRFLLIAVFFLGILFAPIGLLNHTPLESELLGGMTQGIPVVEEPTIVVYNTIHKQERKQLSILPLQRLGVDLGVVPFSSIEIQLLMAPVVETMFVKEEKDFFDHKDISVIQASLIRQRIEKGKNLSLKTPWQASSTDVKVNYQALKIKFHAKDQ